MKSTKIFIAFTFLLSFAVCVSAQSVQFLNELKGYEFYNQGKLKGIKLKISTAEDIKAIFGSDCLGGGCEYNKDWNIGFFYYFDGMKRYKTEDDMENIYVVSPEYVDKLFAIALYPKKIISFNQISFSENFAAETSRGEHGIKQKYYTDSEGLYYTILDDDYDPSSKGNLRHIQYTIPEPLEKDIFILTQIQNKPFSNK